MGSLDAERAGVQAICVTAPTGGGKRRIIVETVRIGAERRKRCAIFTNRRIITRQTHEELSGHGIDFGVVASGYPAAIGQQCLIASVQTMLKRHQNQLPDANWVFIDEAHNRAFDWIVQEYRQRGATIFGYTATPVDLAGLYDQLVVAGTKAELRRIGAILLCKVFSPEQPDLKGVKRLPTGDYSPTGLREWFEGTKWEVFANVFHQYQELNPWGRPTILWAPGVEESRWFEGQFIARGVMAEHLDGTTSEEERERIFTGSREGRVKIICSCGVLREGADFPWIGHGILVQVCGRLSTYLQIVGRLLRNCEGKEMPFLQDHSGARWRHGSPNVDQVWDLGETDRDIERRHYKARQEGKEHEPIRCPKCGLERQYGSDTCPHCGHKHKRSVRLIRMVSGRLVESRGDLVKRKKTVPTEQKVWTGCLYAAVHAKRPMTMAQAAGWFHERTGTWPNQLLKPPPPPHDSPKWQTYVKDLFPWLLKRRKKVNANSN